MNGMSFHLKVRKNPKWYGFLSVSDVTIDVTGVRKNDDYSTNDQTIEDITKGIEKAIKYCECYFED